MDSKSDGIKELKLLEKHINQLGEHFDTIQIFVTKYVENKETFNIFSGTGNYFARYGQIEQWVNRQKTGSLIVSDEEQIA